MPSLPIRRAGLLLALVLSLGPVTGLQVVAWIGMVWDRAPAVGLSEAVAEVVGGDATCRMCVVVQQLSSSDPTLAKLPPIPRLFPPLPIDLPRTTAPRPWAWEVPSWAVVGIEPPALEPPPPRTA